LACVESSGWGVAIVVFSLPRDLGVNAVWEFGKMREAGYPTIQQRTLTILPSSLTNPANLLRMSRLSMLISST
jgi:hypothetical protein